MKHNIRINGEIKTVDCQIGSGILDKNGVEIFEGDEVRTPSREAKPIRRIVFNQGRFFLEDWQMLPLDIYWSCNLEIVND